MSRRVGLVRGNSLFFTFFMCCFSFDFNILSLPFNNVHVIDAAASYHIVNEIVRLSRDENIITLVTIHQPSTKVFRSFSQLMLLSKGRLAFAGSIDDAESYFERIGYPCPPLSNHAGKVILPKHSLPISASHDVV